MALKKVSDVAKNAGISIEETVKVLQASGVQVSNGNDTVKDEDVTAAGLDKRGQLDRRQEMLQKALERHKKGVKIKEVVVSNKNTGGSQQDGPNIKLSKEELKKRKKLMEQHIKKVDEDRIQYNKEKAAQQYNPQSVKKTTVKQETKEMQTVSTDVKTTAVNQNNNTANQNNTIASNNNEASKNSHKQSYNKNTQSRQNFQNKNQDRSKEQKKDDRKDKPFNKNKPSDKNKSFSKDRNEKTDRQFNKDRDKSDKRFQDRDKNSSSDRFRDNKGGKNQQTGGQQRMGNDNVFIAVDEDRKRIVKKKEDENKDKDKESKKTKSKKDSKRSKSWIKTINEGMDELTIENEVDSSPAISPNIDISDLLDVDPDRQPKNNNFNKNRLNKKVNKKQDKSQIKAFVRPEKIEIGEYIVISEFGSLIGVKTTELIKKLFSMGIMASVNQSIDAESAQLLGLEYGVEVTIKTITEDDLLPVYDDKEEDLEKRPPIVTVMGHVDHGKTSLLDAIRSTSVVSGEAGGITQHIGAYEVECSNGTVTFLDTPGHEAFTTLRARGALLTDIVILVVAADDGVKPQTKEAIDHAKAAGVRIVVAINKIDKDGANSDKVKQQLAEYGIIPEEWGGDYQFQEISAKKRLHIDDLLDRVMLEAEILDLKGNKNRPAEGVVIESRLDKQKGPVATVLVKNGTLRRGDTFISGSQFGKVRAMFNYKGLSIKDAGLSIPAEVMGFSELPEAGEKFIVTDEKTAKQVTELRAKLAKEQQMADRGKLSLADFFSKMKDGELKELNIVLKQMHKAH